MRLGIDFGTTRTVVARADRGNYPIVSLPDTDGDAHEYVPSVAALRGSELVYGFEALASAGTGSPLLRSFKRLLGEPGTTLHTTVDLAGRSFPILDVVSGFLSALRLEVLAALSEVVADGERLEAVVSVPAHAHTAQRYLTIEAFRRAGFDVLSLVNEPSAAGFEYTHRQPRTLSSRRTEVLVYDLGGGTFDASLVQAEGARHDVIDSVGVNRLGGDDVDVILAETALGLAAPEGGTVTRAQWRRLVEDSRDAKERLTPQTRRIVLEVADEPVIVPVDAFYAAATPFVEASIDAMQPLVGQLDAESSQASLATVAGIYLVGGGSGLPLVPRLLRERFGRRVYRSPYPAAATAIGLAIAADPDSDFTLTDRLSRGFGVFRERDGGADLGFDEIFPRETELPSGAVTVRRTYRPAHNVGWFRYVEYAGVDEAGNPAGELVPFAEFLFPFDPALQGLDADALASTAVVRGGQGNEIEESYTLTESGVVEVTVTDLTTGYSRRVTL